MKTKKDSNKTSYYIAEPIKKMLDKAKHHVIKSDWDRVYIIDGMEGSGKSLLALQLGYYLDPTLNIDRITFSGEEFSKAIEDAKKNQCIIFDEAFNGLSSTGATSKLNRFIVGRLMECRQKNLFIIIVLPTIFLLQKYAAIFRSKALFHVYTTKKGMRGYYRVYNYTNKKILFLTGQKLYSYRLPKLKKSFRFNGKYPIDEQQYRKKKFESLQTQEKEEKLDRKTQMISHYANILKKVFKITFRKQAELLKESGFDISERNVARFASKIPSNGQKSQDNI